MTVSDFQIKSVLRTYMRNMRNEAGRVDEACTAPAQDDRVMISNEGMKRVLFDRIGEKMTERLRRHEQKA